MTDSVIIGLIDSAIGNAHTLAFFSSPFSSWVQFRFLRKSTCHAGASLCDGSHSVSHVWFFVHMTWATYCQSRKVCLKVSHIAVTIQHPEDDSSESDAKEPLLRPPLQRHPLYWMYLLSSQCLRTLMDNLKIYSCETSVGNAEVRRIMFFPKMQSWWSISRFFIDFGSFDFLIIYPIFASPVRLN